MLLLAGCALGYWQLGLRGSNGSEDSDKPSGVKNMATNPNQPVLYKFGVLRSFPHDCTAYTQGLVYEDGHFYEGTGLTGKSNLRRVELESGKVLQQRDLAGQHFGEGISIWGDRIIQLTWQSGLAFVYNKTSFESLREFQYATEGWGLTHDGKRLIMSDGTQYLYFRDPETFAELGRIAVSDPKGPVVRLNELEYIHGLVFANIWQTNNIAVIDPLTGNIGAWIQLENLLDATSSCSYIDVLNGIAYDQENDRLFVTGKLWPRLYQIELVRQ